MWLKCIESKKFIYLPFCWILMYWKNSMKFCIIFKAFQFWFLFLQKTQSQKLNAIFNKTPDQYLNNFEKIFIIQAMHNFLLNNQCYDLFSFIFIRYFRQWHDQNDQNITIIWHKNLKLIMLVSQWCFVIIFNMLSCTIT